MSDFHEHLTEQITAQLAPLGVLVRMGPLPQAGTAIALSYYDVEPPSGSTDMVQGVQLQVRHEAEGDPRPTSKLAESVFLILHGQSTTTWGGTPIHHVWRNSSADLGADDSRRTTRSDNYYIRLSRVGPHLTDS